MIAVYKQRNLHVSVLDTMIWWMLAFVVIAPFIVWYLKSRRTFNKEFEESKKQQIEEKNVYIQNVKDTIQQQKMVAQYGMNPNVIGAFVSEQNPSINMVPNNGLTPGAGNFLQPRVDPAHLYPTIVIEDPHPSGNGVLPDYYQQPTENPYSYGYSPPQLEKSPNPYASYAV